MRTRIRNIAMLVLLFILIGYGRAYASAADDLSLKGINRVWVLIERLDENLLRSGMTEADLRSGLESRLLEAGITVDPASTYAGEPFLYLEISDLVIPGPGKARKLKPGNGRGGSAGSALYVRLGVQQSVVLKRDAASALVSDTWHQSVIGFAEPGTIQQTGREWVKELTDRFLTAYSNVNGKPRTVR